MLVEDCRALSIKQLVRDGGLKTGAWAVGSWGWWSDAARTQQIASLGYELNAAAEPFFLRLSYAFKADGERIGEPLDYLVRLTTTSPQFGGVRWWLLCPLERCGRRVGKLLLPPGCRYFACRHCHQLAYTSTRQSRSADASARFMAARLGMDFDTARRSLRRMGRRG